MEDVVPRAAVCERGFLSLVPAERDLIDAVTAGDHGQVWSGSACGLERVVLVTQIRIEPGAVGQADLGTQRHDAARLPRMDDRARGVGRRDHPGLIVDVDQVARDSEVCVDGVGLGRKRSVVDRHGGRTAIDPQLTRRGRRRQQREQRQCEEWHELHERLTLSQSESTLSRVAWSARTESVPSPQLTPSAAPLSVTKRSSPAPPKNTLAVSPGCASEWKMSLPSPPNACDGRAPWFSPSLISSSPGPPSTMAR